MTMTTSMYTPPPPTTNSLPHSQRKRLVKSSRKLEAVLGATPLVLEIDIGEPFDFAPQNTSNASSKTAVPATRQPITPRTRARRRRGHVFSSSSCSESSDEGSETNSQTTLLQFNSSGKNDGIGYDSDASGSSYVFVSKPQGIHLSSTSSTNQSTKSTTITTSKNRRRSKSEAGTTLSSRAKTSKPTDIAPPLPPLPMLKNGSSSNTGKSAALKPLSQPILFRLRSVPTSSNPTSTTALRRSSISSSSQSHSRTASTTTTITHAECTPNRASIMTIPETDAMREAREREVRRKRLAKLTRTLGENVPPELVFGSSSSSRSTSPSSTPSKDYAKTTRRSSVSQAPPHRQSPARKTLTAAPAPTPTSKPATTTTTPPRPPPPPKTAGFEGKRTHRPRSLSVPVLYTQVAAFGQHGMVVVEQQEEVVVSSAEDLDSEATAVPTVTLTRPESTTATFISPSPIVSRVSITASGPATVQRARSHSKSHSQSYTQRQQQANGNGMLTRSASTTFKLRGERPAFASFGRQEVHSPVFPARQHAVSLDEERGAWLLDEASEDWGKRKEREWSGEWNLRDMGDVKMKLRGLKGR